MSKQSEFLEKLHSKFGKSDFPFLWCVDASHVLRKTYQAVKVTDKSVVVERDIDSEARYKERHNIEIGQLLEDGICRYRHGTTNGVCTFHRDIARKLIEDSFKNFERSYQEEKEKYINTLNSNSLWGF